MTAYDGFLFPLPDLYQQELSSSLDDGIDPPGAIALATLDEVATITGTVGQRSSTPRQSHALTGHVHPAWDDLLFGHILIIPSRLDLGNILSNQTRTLEIANLYLTEREWISAVTGVAGLTFNNLPAFGSPPSPYLLPSFGSFLLQVGISADGPASIDGTITLDFDVGPQDVPVTGQRVVLWPFQPQPEIQETLEWATNVMEAYDGTEQRMTIRTTPRQRLRMNFIKFAAVERRAKALLFDWLARVFALPLWFEARRTTAPSTVGATSISVDTAAGDFRATGLVFVYSSDTAYEAAEIEAVNASSLDLASELTLAYPTGTLVMPARTVYAKSVPSTPRLPGGGSVYAMEFVTIVGNDLASTSGSSAYDSKVLLDDCNLVESGDSDAWERPVIVLDTDSGRIYQTSRVDRSRFRTRKVWDSPSLAETWRIRQLLHAMAGSRVSFWLPSFRADLVLAATIGPAATTFRVEECGYTALMQSRTPFADVRLVLVDGTAIVRRVTDSEVDGAQEVLTIDSAFDPLAPITAAEVERIEFVNLVRISDDKAEIQHRRLGDASVSIAVVTCKE